MSKVIEFDLPAGALIGKYRHIGGGRFQFDPHAKVTDGLFMQGDTLGTVVEGAVPEGEAFPERVVARIVDKPDGKQSYGVAFVRLFVGDEDVSTLDGTVSESAMTAIRDLMAISDEPVSEWMDASVAPAAPGWYEREGREANFFALWDGTEWLMAFALECPPRVDASEKTTARWRGKVGAA